ncbi:hypothetical protein [Ureaplasma canigenitalium]|uniref:hypothetical protein n=1 Tax=Ureaplasma canigenitalium TaxID=42092 RepID=UPI0004E0EA8F|nr:hypothetical protein [Ureaplasma canigenitalium]
MFNNLSKKVNKTLSAANIIFDIGFILFFFFILFYYLYASYYNHSLANNNQPHPFLYYLKYGDYFSGHYASIIFSMVIIYITRLTILRQNGTKVYLLFFPFDVNGKILYLNKDNNKMKNQLISYLAIFVICTLGMLINLFFVIKDLGEERSVPFSFVLYFFFIVPLLIYIPLVSLKLYMINNKVTMKPALNIIK